MDFSIFAGVILPFRLQLDLDQTTALIGPSRAVIRGSGQADFLIGRLPRTRRPTVVLKFLARHSAPLTDPTTKIEPVPTFHPIEGHCSYVLRAIDNLPSAIATD